MIAARLAPLAAVLTLLAGCTDTPDTEPAGVQPSAPPSPVAASWGVPVTVDGYTITLAAPVDVTEAYLDTDGPLAMLQLDATLTAGALPLDPTKLVIMAYDSNFGVAGVSGLGQVTIPPGLSHLERVFLRVPADQRKKAITIRLTASTGDVEWRQESR